MAHDFTFADVPLPPRPAAGITPAAPPIAESQQATAQQSSHHGHHHQHGQHGHHGGHDGGGQGSHGSHGGNHHAPLS